MYTLTTIKLKNIRNIKVKTKVFSCFRTVDGVKVYLKIMSHISSAVKYEFIRFETIRHAVIEGSISIFAQGVEQVALVLIFSFIFPIQPYFKSSIFPNNRLYFCCSRILASTKDLYHR